MGFVGRYHFYCIKKEMLLEMCFRYFHPFFILLIAWPVALAAEDFKSFDAQNRAASQRNISVKEPKPVGFFDQYPEKTSEAGQNIQSFNYASISYGFPFNPESGSGVSSYPLSKRAYPDDGYDFVDKLREEVREELGDDIHDKMVLTYGEIKEVNSLINSTMAQYGFGDDSQSGEQKYSIAGLDDRLNFLAIFQKGDVASLFSESGRKINWQEGEEGGRISSVEGRQDIFLGVQIRESKFAILFSYLTLINLIYCFLGIIFLVLVFKGLNFFVRRKRSVRKVRRVRNSYISN